MIDVKQSPSGLYEIEVTGRVTEADIEKTFPAFEPLLKSGKPLHLAVDLSGMEGITVKALSRDVQEGFKLIRYLGAPMRYAVITDSDWIAGIARLESFLLPGAEVRSFSSGEKTAAKQWASEGQA